MKKRKRKEKSLDLFGAPVVAPLPLRKAVPRPDGRGWDIAVREPSSTAYLNLGLCYPSKGEAWKAVRSGVGKEPSPVEITVSVTVFRPKDRRRG